MKSLFYFCIFLLFSLPSAAKESQATNQEMDTLPLDELAALADAYALLKKSYVDQLSDKQIFEGALKGMVQNLDPHSQYLSANNYSELKKNSLGEYAGIGIKADHLEQGIMVRHIFKNSPAQKSDLQIGDKIIAIDGQSTFGLSVAEGGALMQGKIGSAILLTVVSEGSEQEKQIELIRSIIEVSTVSAELLADGIGYIRVEEFQALSERHLSQAIFKLQSKQALNGLILDLRNNPGGLLDSAIAISDLFLNQGLIVSTKGRIDEANAEYSATSGDILKSIPMVVLINQNSASASEIVAGALQDHKRAYVIGKRSYGKGSVQTTLGVHGGGAIKLTTALYYTPNDRSIHEVGIEPDLAVEIEITENEQGQVSIEQDEQLVAALNYFSELGEQQAEKSNNL